MIMGGICDSFEKRAASPALWGAAAGAIFYAGYDMDEKTPDNKISSRRGAGFCVLFSLFSNIPFIVTQIVAVCCLAADVFIVKRPVYAVTAVPIEVLSLLYLLGRSRARGGGG